MASFLSILKKQKDEKQAFYDFKKEFENNGDLISVSDLLKIAYQKYPDNTSLIYDNTQITYREFYYRSVLFSKKLIDLGIKPKDKIILFSGNSVDFYIAYFAIWQIGAVVVPINIFLHEKELSYVVKNSDAKAIFSSIDLKPKIDSLNSDISIILTNHDIDWDSVVTDKIEFETSKIGSEELALILYTSGTTGKPKGVMLSSKNIMTNTIQDFIALMSQEKNGDDRFFSVLPLFHVFAQNTCMWLPVLTGSAAIIVKKIERKLILDGLRKKPTIFFGFPALYGLLCLLKTAPLDSVRLFISGADAMSDKIRTAFALIYGRKICAGYGLTEASPVVSVNIENESLSTQFVGFPFVGMDCDIRDDNEKSLENGKIGTLWIKGDNIMMGYYKSPDETDKVLKDGWLNTGDLGYINGRGYLAISGRSKDLIIHKGFNIYPQEIENVLLSHPKIFQAAVVGKSDPSSGQIPVAFVAVKDKTDDFSSVLRQLCSSNLANYKIPKKFICLDKLPMNATGKVDKKKLLKY